MERWRIRKEESTAIVLATTQLLVRSLLEPTLNRRYNTNDRGYVYGHLFFVQEIRTINARIYMCSVVCHRLRMVQG